MGIWKKIKKQDLVKLERHAANHEPYCHLNVIDLWAYKITENYWFELGDTIIYKLNDYSAGHLYITLQGDKDVKPAITKLASSLTAKNTITLKCVPELAKKNIEKWQAIKSIKEDKDNHDYIFDVDKVITFSSKIQKNKSKKIRQLLNKHPNIRDEVIDLTDQKNRIKIYAIFKNWILQTGAKDWKREYNALKRAIKMPDSNLICIGFFDDKKMIGYTINRPEKNGYYQAYFGKSDRTYNSLSLYQEYVTAKFMKQTFGCKYMNLQPDSGISGLRQYKNSLGPSKKLLKYIVEIDVSKLS